MLDLDGITRENFPKSKKFSHGMITLDISCDNNEMYHIKNVEYIKRGDISLYIQFIFPDDMRSKRVPLIVFVQGSAFHWQDVDASIPRLSLLANKGYAIATVQYRGVECAPFPMQILDVKAAIAFLYENAEKYGYDTQKLFLMGDSSGGYTALMCSITENSEPFSDEFTKQFDVKGIIDFYGPTDIIKMKDEPSLCDHISADCPEGYLIGRKKVHDNLDIAEKTVVMNYISTDAKIPPILIFHGTNDETVPFGQSCMLFDKLNQTGKNAQFYAINGANHGGQQFWSDTVLNIVDKFIKKIVC